MADLMVPSKRPRAPSFADSHPDYSETHAASAAFDSFPETEIAQALVNNFLKVCSFCKNNLSHDKDLFMYGHFGSFCTTNCRAKQMACDMFAEASEKIAKAKKGRICATMRQNPRESSEVVALGNTQPKFFI